MQHYYWGVLLFLMTMAAATKVQAAQGLRGQTGSIETPSGTRYDTVTFSYFEGDTLLFYHGAYPVYLPADSVERISLHASSRSHTQRNIAAYTGGGFLVGSTIGLFITKDPIGSLLAIADDGCPDYDPYCSEGRSPGWEVIVGGIIGALIGLGIAQGATSNADFVLDLSGKTHLERVNAIASAFD
ncbi:MAG: hypothetical protein IT211_06635 [Armatimonadetes bacterium]|nr:hypothetical protein [Armatimonadota bacterium]